MSALGRDKVEARQDQLEASPGAFTEPAEHSQSGFGAADDSHRQDQPQLQKRQAQGNLQYLLCDLC